MQWSLSATIDIEPEYAAIPLNSTEERDAVVTEQDTGFRAVAEIDVWASRTQSQLQQKFVNPRYVCRGGGRGVKARSVGCHISQGGPVNTMV